MNKTITKADLNERNEYAASDTSGVVARGELKLIAPGTESVK